jgi:hypothetical protein
MTTQRSSSDPEDWPVEPVEEDPDAWRTGHEPEAEHRDTGVVTTGDQPQSHLDRK